MKLEDKLAMAVRNSLNLPNLEVSVRRSKSHPSWRFRLHKDGVSSELLELDADCIRVMKEIGLLPALHLGTFRVAYAALRRATEGARRQELGVRSQRRPK